MPTIALDSGFRRNDGSFIRGYFKNNPHSGNAGQVLDQRVENSTEKD